MADEAMFCVLVVTDVLPNGQQYYQVEARRDWTLLTLLQKLPSNVVNAISRDPDLYTVNTPLPSDDLQAISRASLESDETKYTKISSDKYVRSIGKDFLADHIYLVILDEVDGSATAVNKLAQNYPELFKCLTIDVQNALHWTKDDVKFNGGIFLEDEEEERKPSQISELEQKLLKQRFYTPENANSVHLTTARSSPYFESSYSLRTLTQDGPNIEKSSELMAFYNMLDCYIPDSMRYKEDKSSSLQTTAMKSNFILPPFFSGRPSSDKLAYHEETSWKFPLFVKCEGMSLLPRKYVPKNDFCVWFGDHNVPFIIGEVVSEKDESDRDRMLLQGIALARLVFALRVPRTSQLPFIVSIYLTRDLTAERYIMIKVESDPDKVFISRKNFDLTGIPDAITFQREMYNLASVLDSIFEGETLDSIKCRQLEGIKQAAARMKSLHTSGAWTRRTKPRPQRRTMNPIVEESDPQAEDDLGVFDEENVRGALDEMKFEVAYVAFGYPHLAPVVSRRDGKIVGCLKFVEDGGNEVEILQYLADLPSQSNHTVRPFGIWPVTGGLVIGMPAAGDCLTSLKDPDTHLWSLTMQLFEAVDFMHQHNVAHLDLKPANILVSSDHSQLTIIDFGVSVLLKSKTTRYSGRVGTEGYIAPEVGHTKFSPISADLWSVGRVVLELCLLCRPSPSRQLLLALSEQLLNDDPSKRPTMSEMLSHDIVKTQLMAPSSLAPMSVLPMPAAVLSGEDSGTRKTRDDGSYGFREHGITENTSTAFRPQTDRQTERANQEIEQYLRIFTNERQNNWAEWLACAEFAINNKVNKSTGFSPFFLNYGHDPRRPLMPVRDAPTRIPRANEFAEQMKALAKESSAALELAAQAMKRAYDKKYRPAPVFSPGDLVLLDASDIKTSRPSKKLDDRCHGPFKVVQVIGEQSYRLQLPPTWSIHNVFHVSKLIPFRPPSFPSQSSSREPPTLAPEFPPPALSQVLDHRFLRSGTSYLVVFEGSSPEDAAWEYEGNIVDPNFVLHDYKLFHSIQ